ncbi:Acyl-coenzyme A thioesterase 13 [Halocaridina rubra]|uniref:Acyl-coenzyme A thioesterase 13 n=1 Tax=Halocaridina rubra TaxID=373956 RepID=A0AAN9A3W7_HALRR
MTSIGARKFIHQITRTLTSMSGFDNNVSKLRIVSAAEGKCTAELTIDEDHQNRMGGLHGGLIATLVDVVAAKAVMSTGKATKGVVTNLRISYARRARVGEDIVIIADTDKVGKNISFCRVTISQKDTGKLVATGSHTAYIG